MDKLEESDAAGEPDDERHARLMSSRRPFNQSKGPHTSEERSHRSRSSLALPSPTAIGAIPQGAVLITAIVTTSIVIATIENASVVTAPVVDDTVAGAEAVRVRSQRSQTIREVEPSRGPTHHHATNERVAPEPHEHFSHECIARLTRRSHGNGRAVGAR